MGFKLADIDEKSSASVEEVPEDDQTNDACTGEEIVHSDSMFKPIYNIGVWLSPDDDENTHVCVAILLFSGTRKRNQIEINVVDR